MKLHLEEDHNQLLKPLSQNQQDRLGESLQLPKLLSLVLLGEQCQKPLLAQILGELKNPLSL